ncbi:MAG: molybdenum cofactor biosynthesis protein MoaE [Thermoprotei archaeon]|nr:MAG: molybdenum cofactor biosynthesis protein MoaE [Thermoprotei archaeon]
MPEGKVIKDLVDVNAIIREMAESTSMKGGGALAIFVGYVKGVIDGNEVHELEYSAYEPYASRKLQEIAEEECRDDGVLDVRIYHRVGSLRAGEPTIYIFVSAVGRAKAFDKARKVLERIKHEVPIFKLEKRADGEYWVIGDGVRMRRPLSQKGKQD